MSNQISQRKRRNKPRDNIRFRQPRTQLSSRINAPKQTSLEKGETLQIALLQSRAVRIQRLMYAPDSVITDLTYPDTVYAKNNIGSAFLSWRYRMNSIYDPDPLVGSGSVPGYTFWSGAYTYYRVLTLGYSIQIMNLEGSPVDVVVVPSIADLGANYSGTNELFGMPYATQSAISTKGGMDRALLKGHIDLGKFTGNTTQYLGNDAYGSSFGTNPGAMNYLNVGGVSSALFTVNNGLDYRVTLTYTVLFTGRKNQIQ